MCVQEEDRLERFLVFAKTLEGKGEEVQKNNSILQ